MGKIKNSFLLLLIAATMLSFSACGKRDEINCPFSKAKWSWSVTEVTAAEGKPDEVIASIYGGDTFLYEKEYLGRNGTLKYMFSKDGKLASVAWAYVSDDAKDIENLESELTLYEENRIGNSSVSPENNTSAGNVWYLDNGDVLISTVAVNGSCGLQYGTRKGVLFIAF